MSLQGADGLRHRLAAIGEVPKDIQRDWARLTVPILRGYVPNRTGRTRASIRATDRSVVGSPVVNFLSSGTKAHDVTAKQGTLRFQSGGKTFFRKKVHKPQQRGQNFKRRAEEEGLRQTDMSGRIVKAWNDAA